MLQGEIEDLAVPRGCLDVLAQQVVACVAMDRWDVPALFDLVRCAYPYRDLTAEAFESVLALVSGRFPTAALPRPPRPGGLGPRSTTAWPPCPARPELALVGGGTIPDTGQYPGLPGRRRARGWASSTRSSSSSGGWARPSCWATRPGGSTAIEPHRVVVAPAEGTSAVMPFWRGEAAPRSPELGEAVGALCREIAGRLDDPGLLPLARGASAGSSRPPRGCSATTSPASSGVAGVVPDDRTILIETFRDPAGELGLAVLTPFGGKLHQAPEARAAGPDPPAARAIPARACTATTGSCSACRRLDEPPLDLLRRL